jgi:tetratricopeptide (TPR) repeat protein
MKNKQTRDSTNLSNAEKIFMKLIEKYPYSHFGYLGMSRLNIIRAYRYGNFYDMHIIHEKALPFANRALELGPAIQEAYDNYGLLEDIVSEDSLERKKARAYVELFPDRPETYFIVGNFMYNHDEISKALEYFGMALRLSPPDTLRVRILKRIALIHFRDYKDVQKASEYYLEALNINGESQVLNEYLGISYFHMKKYTLAVERLSKALELLPSSRIAEYYLMQAKGYMYEEEEKLVKAIEFLKKASVFEANNGSLYYALGNLYYKLEQYDTAYNHFKNVIDLEPHNSSAYFSAGQSAASSGKRDLATDYYRRYLQLKSYGQKAEWIRTNFPEFTKQ